MRTNPDQYRLALAAAASFRSLAGFAFPLFAPAMYNKLGFGKGNTILIAAAVVIGCPAYVTVRGNLTDY
jgi:hypothetical protein